jgi:Tfp pilus assembly protein PilP
MKKIQTFFLITSFLWLSSQTILAQEEEKKETNKEEVTTEIPKLTTPLYNPAGRKDPFRILIATAMRAPGESRPSEAAGAPAGAVISIDNIRLVGIVKVRGRYTAILTGAQEFPLYARAGHKFSDGFIVSIDDNKVVFRKLREGGIPLLKPKDVVKEINPEER